ncbi:hypothetical protein ACN47A_17240 [Myxococcus fulvus]|uniref:hypothetical protein n=1 Tax=Myxococcus fulvus TaxID=33 RepID=UPI003B990EA5
MEPGIGGSSAAGDSQTLPSTDSSSSVQTPTQTGQPVEEGPQPLSPLEQLDARQQQEQILGGTEQQPTASTSDTQQQQPVATAPSTDTQTQSQTGTATGTTGTQTQTGTGTQQPQQPVVMLPVPPTGTWQGSTASSGAQLGAEQQFIGEMVRASDTEVLLSVNGEPQLRLTVSPATLVMVNGMQSVAEDVPEGAQVRAAYTMDETGEATATRIEATSPGGPTGSGTPLQESQPTPQQ